MFSLFQKYFRIGNNLFLFVFFSGEDVQYGIEAERRSKLLRTFVRSAYRYHLSEILATIVNEYTEWERPVQHPVNIRDETLEALSDAQVRESTNHLLTGMLMTGRFSYWKLPFNYRYSFPTDNFDVVIIGIMPKFVFSPFHNNNLNSPPLGKVFFKCLV